MTAVASEQTGSGSGVSQKNAGFTVRWSVLSTILLVITLTSVGTLVVVTTVKGIDTLSTVALALAVLSFAAQLIVTLIQAQQASALSADTKSALTEMQATTGSLLANQRDQFGMVLKAALQQAIPAAVEDVSQTTGTDGSGDAAELEQAINNRLDEALKEIERASSSRIAANARNAPLFPTAVPSARTQSRQAENEWRTLLSTFPGRDEGEPVVAVLRELTPRAISALGRLAGDSGLVSSRKAAYTIRPDAIDNPFDELVRAGLVSDDGSMASKIDDNLRRVIYSLTPSGVVAARLLRATGERPEWAAGL